MRNNMRIESARLTAEDIAGEYFKWIVDVVGANQIDKSYWLLMKDLHAKIFYWSVPNDDNRVYDAKQIRDYFCFKNDVRYEEQFWPSSVSMLELILGLADRCENIMADQPDSIPLKDWFWVLLRNIGLDKFTDEEYYELNGPWKIEVILNKIIDRTYHRDGTGGLFPLKNHKKDQRKVELWYQMGAYLGENYYMDL